MKCGATATMYTLQLREVFLHPITQQWNVGGVVWVCVCAYTHWSLSWESQKVLSLSQTRLSVGGWKCKKLFMPPEVRGMNNFYTEADEHFVHDDWGERNVPLVVSTLRLFFSLSFLIQLLILFFYAFTLLDANDLKKFVLFYMWRENE